jgi:hypothetical protein
VWLLAAAMGLSAFLVFQVQPLVAKAILPWFGGGASVWSVTLMFFQMGLLAGYAYAHLLVRAFRPRTQAIVHLSVLAVAFLTLPIVPPDWLRPSGGEDPTLRLVLVLAVTVGLPYMALTATAPLFQAWYTRLTGSTTPYRLYAISNAGSLLALISYPLVLEPAAGLRSQAWLWSGGYVLFLLLAAATALPMLRRREISDSDHPAVDEDGDAPLPTTSDRVLWVALPAVASSVLVSFTARMTTEVNPGPLLWIIPMSLYLVTFIIAFDRPSWYRRGPFLVGLAVAMAGATFAIRRSLSLDIRWQVLLLSTAVFAVGMSMHGELVRRRPHPQHLTTFYLSVALGGAVGGAFNVLVAPVVFDGLWETHLGVVVALLLAGGAALRSRSWLGRPAVRTMAAAWLGVIAVLGWFLWDDVAADRDRLIAEERSFYGVLRVRESDGTRELLHGATMHGMQFTDPVGRTYSTSYYGQNSGVGLAFAEHPKRRPGLPLGFGAFDRSLRVGAVGLGTGSILSHAGPGDSVLFYEVDKNVVDMAGGYFTYLSDAASRGVDVEILLGDARLVMERQLEEVNGSQGFDLLVIDAFSGDSVPTHLLTVEAFAVYRDHLAPDGLLAIHASNRFLDLGSVIVGAADYHGLTTTLIVNSADSELGVSRSRWLLVSDGSVLGGSPAVQLAASASEGSGREPVIWIDDHSSLLEVLD